MIYRIRHATTYRYGETVDLSTHVLRLRPRAFAYQRVLEATIDTAPDASWWEEAVDHFGNHLTLLAIEDLHTTFTVTARSRVEVKFPPPPAPALTPPWEEVRAQLFGDGLPVEVEAAEYLHPSPLVMPDGAIHDYARESFPAGRTIVEAVLDLNRRIHRDFTFDPDATEVSTPPAEVMRRRRGVCQDFAHVEIACLRSMGLAARYVSGYIRTHRPAGQLVGADASHAWVSFFCPGWGWIDVDPTNDLVLDDEHVVVAWGRDYADVSPIRGVILGGGEHRLDVAVHMEGEP